MGQHKKHLDWVADDAGWTLKDGRGGLANVVPAQGVYVAFTRGQEPLAFPTHTAAIDHVERIVAQRHMPLFLTGRLVFHSHLGEDKRPI
jgi:hypothetical protein